MKRRTDRRVGKANGSRERAPDDKLRVPTMNATIEMVGTAQERLCPPYFILPGALAGIEQRAETLI